MQETYSYPRILPSTLPIKRRKRRMKGTSTWTMECSHEQHDECNLEVSGDSEEVFGVVPRPMAAEEEEERDDAESCVDDGGDDRRDVIREETRWSSWRVWCEESAIEYEPIGEENGCDASREKSTVEMEENRLFWEACLANDYSGQT